jgi:hypothetical protein
MRTHHAAWPASIAALLLAIACAAACDRSAPTARDRLLAAIRGDAVIVAVADSRAIAHPRVRGVLDVIAARWPARMGCVLEAAFAGDAVALTVDRSGSVTALIATTGAPRCAALSQREPGVWIATIGAGPSAQATSVLDDARFARARPYLTSAPFAAVSLDEPHLLATAQPEPLEAWLAVDAPGHAQDIERAIAEHVARMQRDPATAALAAHLRTSRAGDDQVVVRLEGPFDGDLAVAARAVLAGLDEQARPAAARFACPTPAAPDIECTGGAGGTSGTSYRVGSLRTELASIVTAGQPAPIVTNGLVTGLRLEAAVPRLGLDAGDVVLAVAGRLVTSRAMLADRIAHARGEIGLTIRRGTSEKVLQFAERRAE